VFAQEQQESVDTVEENVSTAEQNVESGVKTLAKVNILTNLFVSSNVFFPQNNSSLVMGRLKFTLFQKYLTYTSTVSISLW